MAVRIQVRRGTTSEWNSADPTLFEGEFGYNTTLDKFKIGDGTSSWSVLEYVPTSADLSTSLGDYIALTEKGGADGVAELDASFNVLTKTAVVFEGTTADAYETTLFVTEPTADRTITLPNATGTVALTSDITTAINNILDGAPAALDTLNELAAAINDDASYASTITTALGGKIDKSTIDAAGDLLIGTADNTVGRLAIGTNGYLLTSNGTTATWAAAPISLPSQTGNSGKYLTTDGSTASWATISADIESVTAGTGLTGGGTSGAVTVSLDTTSIYVVPSQTGNSGKYLTTNGTVSSWATVSSYSAPTLGSTSIASGATVTTIAGLTLSSPTITGSLTAGGGTGTSGQVLASTGSGVQWTTPAAGAAFSEFMLIGA